LKEAMTENPSTDPYEETEEAEDPAYDPPVGGARRKRRTMSGCLIPLLALAVILGAVIFGVTKGAAWLKDQFASAPDYPGPGSGKVLFEVKAGDSSTVLCREMKNQKIVASVDACITAANGNPDASKIQVGFYPLKREMKAEDAVALLVDPKNIRTDTITIPEGLRVTDVVDILASKTKYDASDFQKVLDDPSSLGLPDYANNSAEGYLFPATYPFGPNEQPVDMLKDMVDRWRQAADDADLEGAASDLGYTPAELMTVASLVEAEGRGDDMPKIARVIYNRIENPENGETNGLLQIDATVNYALHRKGTVAVTVDETQNTDSPYNTYVNTGLPPGPIEAPGDEAIAAAAHPAEGSWLYYVTVNLKTGLTKFTDNYDEFLTYKNELKAYCETSDAC
jgi:UPF0755 protein